MNTNWTTKEEYLQFVRDWKHLYKLLTLVIRTDRQDGRICQSQAAGGKRFAHVTEEQLSARAEARASMLKELKGALGSFWCPSAKATELLEIRKEEKIRAGEARAAALAAGQSASV